MTVMLRCDWFQCGSPPFGIKFPLLTHLRDSNLVQFQQSLFTAKVSYHTVIGYSVTTIFDRVTGISQRPGLQWEENKENRDCEAVYISGSKKWLSIVDDWLGNSSSTQKGGWQGYSNWKAVFLTLTQSTFGQNQTKTTALMTMLNIHTWTFFNKKKINK